MKLAAQRERKKERKAKVASTSSSVFSPTMPIPLCSLSSSFDNVVVSSVASSPASSSPIISMLPFLSPNVFFR